MLKNLADVHSRDTREKFHKFCRCDTVCEILKKRCHRNTSAAEHPGTTDLPHISLDDRTLSPAQGDYVEDIRRPHVNTIVTTCNLLLVVCRAVQFKIQCRSPCRLLGVQPR